MSIIRKLDPRHWRYIKRTIDVLREKYFSSGAGKGMAQIKTDLSLDEAQTLFGKHHFTNSWELSYQYQGEDMNMRRPEYVDDEYNWYQLHVRGFETDDGLLLYAHLELEPTEYPYDHIRNVNFNDQKGFEMMREILDEEDVTYINRKS